MLLIFGLVRRAGPRVLAACYVVAGLGLFLFSVVLANEAGYVPHGAPACLQNPLKGPSSSFPVAPWVGFTFYGAAIGVLVRQRTEGGRAAMSPWPFLVLGILLKVTGWPLDRMLGGSLLDGIGHGTGPRVLPDAFHGRIGEILIVLGVLVWIECRLRPGASWFQTIGRNTFPIYVGHVIVLYGGIFGIGLHRWLEKSLNPWQAALGAVIFCGIFGLCAQWVEPLELRWKAWRCPLRGGK
jgi:xanthine/uracil/vitamin C permease (AzgA family)